MKIIPFILTFGLPFFLTAQVLDMPPIGKENYRVFEGGSAKVEIDWETPLDDLIAQLDGDWQIVETGKGYWIGYTDVMYSIAARKNKAIGPLISFVKNAKTRWSKLGALLTIHLIGIESTIVGRYEEDFKNINARNALLGFLRDQELHQMTLELLSRDPWLSDIPVFIQFLQNNDTNYEELLSVLQNYEFSDRPFTQPLPEDLALKQVKVAVYDDYWPEMQIMSLYSVYADSMIIDLNIRNSDAWKSAQVIFNESLMNDSRGFGMTLEYATGFDFLPSYGMLDNKYYYTYFDGIITIFGPKLARDIWLSWWKDISEERREEIRTSAH